MAKACADQVATDATNLANQVRQNTRSSIMGLQQLMIDVGRLPRPKTVLLLSEGLYLDRDMNEVTWVAGQAAASRVSLYGIVLDDTFADIDTSQRRPSPTRMDDRQLRLNGLHILTGMARGATYEVVAGADSAFDRIARELTGYYLVAFEPLPTERDGRKHDISIKVARSGVEVRARREFTVDRTNTAARTDEDLLAESLRDPLLATERRMRVATYALPDPQSANVRLLISAGLGVAADELAIRSVAFKLTDSQGNIVASRIDKAPERTGQDHRYLGTVVVPPGSYTLKIAGVDEEGRRGSVEHLLKAALSTAGALTMSELVLGQPPDAGDNGLKPAIEPDITETAATAYLELSSKDAARLGDAAVRVEVASGPNAPALVKADAGVSDTSQPGRKLVMGEIALDDLQPGTYVARAVVQVGGEPVARVLRSFRYAPGSGVRRASAGWRRNSRAFDRASVLQPDVVGPAARPDDATSGSVSGLGGAGGTRGGRQRPLRPGPRPARPRRRGRGVSGSPPRRGTARAGQHRARGSRVPAGDRGAARRARGRHLLPGRVLRGRRARQPGRGGVADDARGRRRCSARCLSPAHRSVSPPERPCRGRRDRARGPRHPPRERRGPIAARRGVDPGGKLARGPRGARPVPRPSSWRRGPAVHGDASAAPGANNW